MSISLVLTQLPRPEKVDENCIGVGQSSIRKKNISRILSDWNGEIIGRRGSDLPQNKSH